MRFIVVNTETTLAELRGRALAPGLSEALRAKADDAIRLANPGLDLARLTPGTVVVLPSDEESEPYAGIVAGLAQVLKALEESASVTAKAGLAQHAELSRLFKSTELRKLADNDKALHDLISDRSKAVAVAARRAGERSSTLIAAAAALRAALAASPQP